MEQVWPEKQRFYAEEDRHLENFFNILPVEIVPVSADDNELIYIDGSRLPGHIDGQLFLPGLESGTKRKIKIQS